MAHVRAALFLDFDNVFGGLHRVDPRAAVQFAQSPETWLTRLTTALTIDGPRRWLLLRCYLNPAGSVPGETPGSRIHFSTFRTAFIRAGFDVIDCPKLTHTKNAADIRMVLEAADFLRDQPRCEEFVIASGDSDMTPLLHRLRAADRRTTIFSPSDAVLAFTAVADRLIGADQVLQMLETGESDDELETTGARQADLTVGTPTSVPTATVSDHRDEHYLHAVEMVRATYLAARGPLNLSSLSTAILREVPEAVSEGSGAGRWFGSGSFVAFLSTCGLSGLTLGNHQAWDANRHEAPDGWSGMGAPEVVVQVSSVLGLPRVERGTWGRIFAVLGEYASTHTFNLTESTKWSRDRLLENGPPISRGAIGAVVRGAAFGGCPLHRRPAPDAEDIQAAFVANLLARVGAADRELSESESDELRDWFSA